MIAPLRVVMTSWPNEIAKWEDFNDMTYTLVHGDRRKAMELDRDIYLMNVEGMNSPEWCAENLNASKKRPRWGPNPYAKGWLRKKKVMLVVDESTRFKSASSLRFQYLKTYLPFIPVRTILTGTPQPNSVEDLFSQCYITDEGKDLGKFITHFRNTYMQRGDYVGKYVALPHSLPAIAKKIAPTTVQAQDDDDDLPTREIDLWVEMPPDIKTIYNKLKRDFIVEIGDDVVMTPNAGVLFNKLRQLAQGALYMGDEGRWEELFPDKIYTLINVLEELNGEPLFALYQYRHDYMRLEREMGSTIPRVGAGISAKLGAMYCNEFSAGQHPLLLGHPLSVAHGIDGLQNNCHNVLWLGVGPSWEDYYQANLRIARQGTKAEQTNIYRVLTNCAVEKACLKMVERKRGDEASLLGLLRSEFNQE